MGYRENAVYYRRNFVAAVREGRLTEAKINSVAYSKLLRCLSEQAQSINDKVALLKEAMRYEDFAISLLKEGITPRLKYAIENGVPLPPQMPVTSAPDPIAAAPKEPPKTIDSPTKAEAPASLLHSADVEWSADMFDRYKGATVAIRAKKDKYSAGGTGFFISKDGLLITNHHVAYSDTGSPAKEIFIKSGDDKIITNATLIVADQNEDVALLKADGLRGETPFIPFVADDSTVRAGIDTMIIGNGLSFGLAPVTGTVKFPDLTGDLVYTAQTNGGDSGSPLINRRGECIGIHKAREDESGSRAARGIAYATPAHTIKKLVLKWREKYKL